MLTFMVTRRKPILTNYYAILPLIEAILHLSLHIKKGLYEKHVILTFVN